MHEVELKFLDIDVSEIKRKILALGATEEFSSEVIDVSFNSKAYGFDHGDSSKKVFRLRSMNGKNYLTFKGPTVITDVKIRDEVEIEVNDFDKTVELFTKAGFTLTKGTRKHRTHFSLGTISFEIDTYDNLSPYLEIEAHSSEELKAVCTKLGLRFEDGTAKNIVEILRERGLY